MYLFAIQVLKELEDVYKQLDECSEEYLQYKVRNQSPVVTTPVNTPDRRELEAGKNVFFLFVRIYHQQH